MTGLLCAEVGKACPAPTHTPNSWMSSRHCQVGPHVGLWPSRGPDGGFSSPVSGAQDHHLLPTPNPVVTGALLFPGPPWGAALVIPSAVKHSELGIHAALGPRLAQEEREAREQALLVGGAGAEPGPPAPPGPLPAPTSPARDSAAAAKASLHQGPSQGWARGLEGPWGRGPAGTVPGQPPAHTPSPSCPS